MKILYTFFLLFSFNTYSKKLSEFSPYNYEVYFTNPICEQYNYEKEVYNNDGQKLISKPKNVYCKIKDKLKNYNRELSPNFQIRKIIKDPEVKELFLTFLSFSDQMIADEICSAIKNRNLKVTMIIDSKNNLASRRESALKRFNQVKNCKALDNAILPGENRNIPRMELRGNEQGLGFAHNKIIIANYNDSNKVTIVFGSGNLSSGTVTHHENWHFVTTSKKSYFYKIHDCLKIGMLEYGNSKKSFKNYVKNCRAFINQDEEEDIKLFIIPSDGKKITDLIKKNIERSNSLDVAVHRFSNQDIITSLINAAKNGKEVRLIADDDIFWTAKLRKKVGSNTPNESGNVGRVRRAGAKVKYMETNEKAWQVHHNKFIVFNYLSGEGELHVGAGNFTKAAFTNNYENFYHIKIPSVIQVFRKQYNYLYNNLASHYNNLPSSYATP